MFTNRLFNLLILAGLLVITACGPQSEPSPTVEATVVPTATATIVSTATTAPTVIPTVTPTAVPTEVGSFPIGKFLDPNDESVYWLFKNGKWSHWADKFYLAGGTYSVEGDTYIQTSNSGGCPVPMSYKFSFDGKNLKFQLTDESRNDPCPDRMGFYDNTSYIFSP